MTKRGAKARTGQAEADVWGQRVQDWIAIQEATVRPLYEEVFDRLRIAAGTRLLDAGCGSGLALAVAADRGAEVSGFDATPAMVAAARLRVPGADIRVGDLEEVPFRDCTFDAITGFNSFQYAGDPTASLREAGRVGRASARVVIAVWGTAEETEASAYLEALGRHLPPPPPGAAGPFALSEDGALAALVRSAGLRPLEEDVVLCPWEYSDLESALRGLLSAGPAVRAVIHSGEARVREAVTSAIAPFRRPSGSYLMRNRFRFMIAAVD